MKILHVIANLASRYGGPSKACFEMAKAVSDMGHKVSIYTTNQDGNGELPVQVNNPILKEGVEITYFPIQLPRFWGFSSPLGIALRKNIPCFDVVHIHSLYLFHNFVAPLVCRKHKIPYLIRPHGTLDPFIYKRHRIRKTILEFLFEKRNMKYVSAIHFTSQEERELAKPFIGNAPCFIIQNGLNLSDYNNLPIPGTFRNEFPETKNKIMLLFFGRVNFKKGLDLLSKAFAYAVKIAPNLHLVIAGPDNEGYGEKVKGWLKSEGVLEKTTFTGLLEGDRKLALLQDADIFVLPSYSENFGFSVIEAMVCGKPVIISNKVNICKEVEEANAGLVGDCKAQSFYEMIFSLVKNLDLGKKMGENGRKLVKDKFQWKNIAYELEKAYDFLIKKNNSKN